MIQSSGKMLGQGFKGVLKNLLFVRELDFSASGGIPVTRPDGRSSDRTRMVREFSREAGSR